MNLNARVVGALAAIILLTLVAAWLLAGRMVLRPFMDGVFNERADTAEFIAREVEQAPDPRRRAEELAREMGLRIELVEIPPFGGRHGRGMRRHGRAYCMQQGPQAPLFVPLTDVPGFVGMLVFYPLDIDRPSRNIGLGLLLIGGVVLLGAFVASRWALRPVDLAGRAMDRVAGGDFTYRLPEGGDATGRMGRSFNTMTTHVETLLRGQRRLMAAVSHELRTPLARMRLELELLRDQGAQEQRIQSLESDIAEVDALVGEILESARLDQGVLALKMERLDALPLAEDAVGLSGIEGRDINLDISKDLPAFEGDRARLLRVLVNLLVNADRYTPPTARIRVHAERAELVSKEHEQVQALVFSVEDDGPGVPEASLSSLFEPFFRVEQSRSRATGGLGLGLMLVRQIVEAHGGRVEARNRAEGGLVICFWIPTRGGQ